jgi:hypothetical protein
MVGSRFDNVPEVDAPLPSTGGFVNARPIRPPAMRGRRAVYRPDHKSFGAFILSEEVRDAVAEVAKDIAPVAGRLAPRSESDGPHMADQFRVNREAGTIKVSGNVRVQVDVYNEDPAAAPNEFGTRRNERHRMLVRAAEPFGDFKDHGDGL